MKTKLKALTLTLLIIFSISILSACKRETVLGSSKPTTYTGYLLDQMCGAKTDDKCEMDKDSDSEKVDFSKNPEKHTNACNQMPSCAKAGFGISIKQKDDSYKYYKFDETGSKLAKEQIVDKTKKKDNLVVTVEGTINKDVIKISSISEN